MCMCKHKAYKECLVEIKKEPNIESDIKELDILDIKT